MTTLPADVRERLVRQLLWVLGRRDVAGVGLPVVLVAMHRSDAKALLAWLGAVIEADADAVRRAIEQLDRGEGKTLAEFMAGKAIP